MRKKQFFLVMVFFLASFVVFAGGRQDAEKIQFMTELEVRLCIGKDFRELRNIPGIQGLEPPSQGAVPNPRADWIFTDIYGSKYRMTIYYRIDGPIVDSARIFFRSPKDTELEKMYNDACEFLKYYGAYDEYYDVEGHSVFHGDRHSARIDWNRNNITLILDDKIGKLFPHENSQKLR